MKSRSLTWALVGVLAFSAVEISAFADDETASIKFDEGQSLYAEREDLAKNEAAIAVLAEAEAQAHDPELKYDILILSSRAYYWKGTNARTKDEKIAIYELGMNQALKAQALDQSYAEGFYFYAINLGKWGLARGIIESLFKADELKAAAKTAMEKVTRSFEQGEIIDSYGPHRTLGYAFFKLPRLAGGSRSSALYHLKRAYELGPETALNHVYYAEALADGDRDEKKLARKILNNLLAQDPTTFNPDKVPETKSEFEEARKLLAEIND